ncbi:hypothetical protein H7170_00440 [Candidatus Gracilibacteria bacterium]|nr:hypothetical protein [Candidatus Gracilibacteria bacterium]
MSPLANNIFISNGYNYMTFSRSHFSTIICYIGVSFITGAISHGFFSGTRSLITGAIGVVCFIIGTLMEEGTTTGWKSVISGAILAVGIGAVTGGLQHFPDSPERSLWILPVGFALSLVFYALVHGYKFSKKEYTYASISLVSVICISIGIFAVIENTGITGHRHNVSNSVDLETAGIEATPPSENIVPMIAPNDHHN